MGTAKRDRQRANRQQRLEELARDARRGKTKRWGLRFGIGIPVVIALLFALAYLTRDKKNASTPVDSVPTTTPISVAPSTVLGGSAGESSTTVEASTTTAVLAPFAYGKGGCPAADGSSIKQSKFTQAFKLCIDPAKKYTATFETSEGAIVVDLDTSDVPGTVNNFVTLARFHYYDGTSIFRADSSIDIIQGGGKSNGATPGYKIPDEKNGFTYSEGDLVMARTGEPNSAGSQWFFAGGPKVSNLATEGTYVTFGKVTSGMDVVKKILGYADPNGQGITTPVAVKTVTIAES